MINLAQKYQRKTEIERILKDPGVYIGSLQPITKSLWVYDEKQEQILPETIELHEALYKLIDEALTNCYDHAVRTSNGAIPVTTIKIDIDGTYISFINDGEGIDVEKHPELDIYIPEMIFAHLGTSSNYGDENKIVGGKHGLGIKLVSIWSTHARIELIDQGRKLSYTQDFNHNLSEICPPVIKPLKRDLKSGITKIIFTPDFARFGLAGLPEYMERLFKKRAYDISVLLPKVKIYFNKKLLVRRTFKTYLSTCFPSQKFAIHESKHWKVALYLSETGYSCLSLVNGIQTLQGGIHANEVTSKIIAHLTALLKERKKVAPQPRVVRDFIGLFITCDVINPTFIGQIKEALASGKFCEPLVFDTLFVESAFKLIAGRVCEHTTAYQEYKKKREVEKLLTSSNGAPRMISVRGIPELTDATWAGSPQSAKCALIICEGESSATGVLSGLSSSDRDIYGVYPIRGKLLNPNKNGLEKIAKDKILIDLKKILGLESGKKYADMKKLRYGRIIFMTDQDLDGHHIKGLGINLFNTLWPTLIKLKQVFGFIQTPIIRARKNGQELTFYHDLEYQRWKTTTPGAGAGWSIKYYKGLGTSTSKEFKEYFKNPRTVYFTFSEGCLSALETAFGKNADHRKEWLSNYNSSLSMTARNGAVSYSDFINKEFIHFSKYDCDRSIPAIDGLKISQRKILYVAKLLLKDRELKVAQFCGNVAEKTHYHHGEVSLEKAVVGMAQDFVGSNNLNLLLPLGQFGSRRQGGEDSASARYLFTRLNNITHYIYRREDEPILKYAEDDGYKVEPHQYAPIIPMILVNGALGIGTGFSCSVLPHNIVDVIDATLAVLNERTPATLVPYFRGFLGRVEKADKTGYYSSTGLFTKVGYKILVNELPVGIWSLKFKQRLEDLVEKNVVKSYIDRCTDTKVYFEIWTVVEMSDAEIVKSLKLQNSHSETNMYLFDYEDKLRKFTSAREIIEYYIPVRLEFYRLRKAHMIGALEQEILVARNKMRYIFSIIEGKLSVFSRASELLVQLAEEKYDLVDGAYSYLLKMTIDCLCADNAQKLEQKRAELEKSLECLRATTLKEIWERELKELKDHIVD